MLIAPHEPIDLLVGCPKPERNEVGGDDFPLQNWYELLTNGYLAFQAGYLNLACKLYVAARAIYPLPIQRKNELSAAEYILEGHTVGAEGLAVIANSAQRQAFLMDGLSEITDEELIAQQAAADLELINSLYLNLSGPNSAAAADKLNEIAKTSPLPATVRSVLAFHLGAAGRHNDSIHHLKIVMSMASKDDPRTRGKALGWLATAHVRNRNYAEGQMAAREALRFDLSNVSAISALAAFEFAVNLDVPMRALLELRMANIEEGEGRFEQARTRRAQLQAKGPSYGPYLGP
jgi:hypothetical protein